MADNSFRDLIGKHKNKRIAVLGGGAGLEEQLQQVKADLFISANEHGAKLHSVDYIVSMDDYHTDNKRPMMEHLRQYSDAPVIGPFGDNDYTIPSWPGSPKRMLSGVVGIWLAQVMGAKAIYLLGADAYHGKDSAMREYQFMSEQVPTEIRLLGEDSPLASIFTLYDPKERFKNNDVLPPISGYYGGDSKDLIRVLVRKNTSHGGRQVVKGQELEGSRHEFRRLLKHRVVEEIQ